MERTLPALRLQKSPLVLVLSQVKISPILGMEKFLPEIQEQLRRKGYPRFRTSLTQEITLVPEPKVMSSVRWLFSDKEERTTAVIAPNFITLLTSKYEVFERFAEAFRSVLETVGKIAEVGLAERLGLRYVDLVRLGPGEQFSEYFEPGLLGLSPEKLRLKSMLSRYESLGVTEIGQLIIRLLQLNNGQYLPPDVDPTDVKQDVVLKQGEVVCLLDIDHFTAAQRDFDTKELISELWRLHDSCDRAFRQAVTPVALERWGAMEVARKS